MKKENSELEKSRKEVGEIFPVLKDQHGNVIDGLHRKEANPSWREEIVRVESPLHALKIRVHSNMVRRDIKEVEKQSWIMDARKLLNPSNPMQPSQEEVAKALGLSWHQVQRIEATLSTMDNDPSLERELTPYSEGMYYLSEKFQISRKDSFFVIKNGEPYPTLHRRCWFFHEDGREFSLREYAQVQEFPNDYVFVGSKEDIKNQIGNAVPPTMAFHIAKQIPQAKALSLFAGAGGMTLGFAQAKHEIIWATDIDEMCYHTFHSNFPLVPYEVNDIRKLEPQNISLKERPTLIFGGPPCQGFSLSGLRFKDDPRNELYKDFLRFVDYFQPRYFIMENVPGIRQFIPQIVEDMEALSYGIEVELIKGEQIGMKQKRHRWFFIGSRHTN
jgi:site-specific DNA-cytosine methylase